jgi:hypothetical protein
MPPRNMPLQAQTFRGGIAIPIVVVGTRGGWVGVNATPWPLYPLRGAAVPNFRGNEVACRAGLDRQEEQKISCPHRESNALSSSL